MKNNLLTEKLAYNGESRTKTHIHLIRYTAEGFGETLCDDFSKFEPSKDPAEKLWGRVHGLEDATCIQEVCTHFGVNFLAVQDILNVDHPSKVEVFDNYNFLISSIPSNTNRPFTGSCMFHGMYVSTVFAPMAFSFSSRSLQYSGTTLK